jgi:hypothetical protein
MQATITYYLTEIAQRAQMAATGQPVTRKQIITVDVQQEDWPLMQIAEDGSLYLDLTAENQKLVHYHALRATGALKDVPGRKGEDRHMTSNLYQAINQPSPDILALIRAGNEKLAAKQRAEDAEKAAVRASVDDAIRNFLAGDTPVTDGYYRRHVKTTGADLSMRDDELAKAYIAEATRRHEAHEASEKARIAESDRRYREEKERKETEQAALEERKTAAIAEWIAGCGDALLQQQQADGLLCRKTVISRMAEDALDATGLPAECPDSVVCDDNDCPCCDKVVDCIPPKIYACWKTFPALPEGSSVEWRRVRNCLKDEDGCYDHDRGESAGPVEYHANVTVPSGPFQFTRRIKV